MLARLYVEAFRLIPNHWYGAGHTPGVGSDLIRLLTVIDLLFACINSVNALSIMGETALDILPG